MLKDDRIERLQENRDTYFVYTRLKYVVAVAITLKRFQGKMITYGQKT